MTTVAPDAAPAPVRDPLGPVVARLDRPHLADPVSVGVVADPHLAVEDGGTWKVLHRTEARLRSALDVATGAAPASDGVDAVVFAGDLTRDGLRSEFDRFDTLVDGLDRPWTAVPGNHDVPKSFDDHPGIGVESFRRRYVGDGVAPPGPCDYPVVLRVGDLRLVCLNTAAPPSMDYGDTWSGAVGPTGRECLRETLKDETTPRTVVVAHHNLGSLPEHEPGYPWEWFAADDAGALRDLLAESAVPLAVTGHHHVPAVRDHGSLTELMAPAVCSFPQAMLTIHVDSDGTTVRFVPLADAEGVRESYWHAATGKPLGRGILDMTLDRVPRP